MQVISERSCTQWKYLHTVKSGSVVRFKHSFHQGNCNPEDIFLVNQVISGYRPQKAQYDCKLGVTNLRSGNLSYVERDREIEMLVAHVVIERDC